MSEYVEFLRHLAEMLKSLGKVVDELGEKVNEFAELQKKPKSEEKVTPEPAPKLEAKPAEKRAEKTVSATETVLNIIQKTRNGVSISAIKEKTGFDSTKINGILNRLKKSGRIKSEKKGVYTRS